MLWAVSIWNYTTRYIFTHTKIKAAKLSQRFSTGEIERKPVIAVSNLWFDLFEEMQRVEIKDPIAMMCQKTNRDKHNACFLVLICTAWVAHSSKVTHLLAHMWCTWNDIDRMLSKRAMAVFEISGIWAMAVCRCQHWTTPSRLWTLGNLLLTIPWMSVSVAFHLLMTWLWWMRYF